jgi:proteic killer suppression protein
MASASGENEEPLIISFRDRGTEDIFDGEDSKAARKTLPAMLHGKAGGTLDRLNSAVSLRSLSLPGLHLEKLRGDRSGQHSIRINDQYRVCFRWTESGAEDVEIVDYH